LEAKPIEFRAKHAADFLNARKVQRAAVDVDDLLEQGQAVCGLRVDVRRDRLLFRGERGALPGAREDGRERKRHDDQPVDTESRSHLYILGGRRPLSRSKCREAVPRPGRSGWLREAEIVESLARFTESPCP